MSLEEVHDVVFSRGVGISRRNALQTLRFKQLSETMGHESIAEIQYLGERLADRAFCNLPKFFREEAKRWNDGDPSMQHSILEMLAGRLRSSEWQKFRADRDEHCLQESQAGVMPACYKSWQRGTTIPNCLGMAQMLVGFARQTGANHFLVTTLVRSDHYAELFFMRSMRLFLEEMSNFLDLAPVRRISRLVQSQYVSSLTVLDYHYREERAHHALLIQKADKSWWMIDPYMGILAEKHFDGEGAASFLNDNPGGCITDFVLKVDRYRNLKSITNEVLCLIRNPRLKPSKKVLLSVYESTTSLKRRRRQYVRAFEEIMSAVCSIASETLTQAHPSVEITASELGIAVMTLNHVAGERADIQLTPFMRSQYLARDDIARASDKVAVTEKVMRRFVGHGSLPVLSVLPALRNTIIPTENERKTNE